jgi:hypothetical protein
MFTIPELTPAARARALEEYRQQRSRDWDTEMLSEDLREELDLRELRGLEPHWLLHVQGAGVAFDGVIRYEDLMRADTRSWSDAPNNVRLDPDALRAAAPVIALLAARGVRPDLSWRAKARGTLTEIENLESFYRQIDFFHFDALDTYFPEAIILSDGREEATTGERFSNRFRERIEEEAAQLDLLIRDYLKRLSGALLETLYARERDLLSDEALSDEIEELHPGMRWDADGALVLEA